ncbi:AaceriABR095Cp [[Ashbya] aceris (nom. inval.)]|nr:AaceriABR095Cp [[Ashbya] aceris (nom. inval.)]
MSMYLTLLFLVLILEMSVLFVLVLPLPFRIRKLFVRSYDKLQVLGQLRTVAVILYGLVGMLFLDSWWRAQRATQRFAEGTSQDPLNTGLQAFATKTYNERNLYISGFIMYFSICIPTVVNILKSLIRHYELGAVAAGDDSEEVKLLRQELKGKQASLAALRSQKKNLEAHFDSSTETGSQDTAAKKKQ